MTGDQKSGGGRKLTSLLRTSPVTKEMLHEARRVSSLCCVIGQCTFPDSVTYFSLPALSPPPALLLSLFLSSLHFLRSYLVRTSQYHLSHTSNSFLDPSFSIYTSRLLHSVFWISRIGSLLSHLLIGSPCKLNHRFLICCPLCSFSRLNPFLFHFLLQLNIFTPNPHFLFLLYVMNDNTWLSLFLFASLFFCSFGWKGLFYFSVIC